MKFIVYHLVVNLVYMSFCCLLVEFFPIINGLLNGISCGIIMYDVMIEKLAHNYE